MIPSLRSSTTRRLACLASLLPAAAGASTVTAPARPHQVTITAHDYAFDAPDTLPAGLTTITLRNRGHELHHVQLVRLEGGHTLPDFLGGLKAGGPPPEWAHLVGGPNTPVPGADAAATLDLAPGRYALVCFIPSADGAPHVMKGMSRELTVIAADHDDATRSPVPSATMTLTDYAFALSRPLASGTTTLRVRNEARQPHEVLFLRLAPGKHVQDFASWVEHQAGPPPAAPIGGTSGIEHGGWNDLTLSLTPGHYALVCFLPDGGDGKPHAAHGMMREFAVR